MSSNATLGNLTHIASSKSIPDRVHAIDWQRVSQDLDEQGSAVIERLLSPSECQAIAALYTEEGIFRSQVIMGRHGFGRGEYKYFSYPLPDLIADLRTTVYPQLI